MGGTGDRSGRGKRGKVEGSKGRGKRGREKSRETGQKKRMGKHRRRKGRLLGNREGKVGRRENG